MENTKSNRSLFTIIVILLLAILALIVFGIIPCSRKEKISDAWCYDFNYDIGRNERSNDVKALQLALQKEGLFSSDDISGLFDDDTADAVIAFQQKYPSILASVGASLGTGYVDRVTREKLNELYGCEIEPEQIEWVTYRNEDYRYEIGYPNILTDGDEYIPEDALHKMWRRNSTPSSWESLNVFVAHSQYDSFDQLWTNVNKQAEERFSTVAREKCIEFFDKIEVQEHKGSKILYNFKAGCVAPPDTINSEAIILRENKAYRIFHSCNSGLDCRNRFNQILERFRFLEEEPSPTPTPTEPLPPQEPTPTPTPTPTPPPPAPPALILGSLAVGTSPSIPENQKYPRGEIGARLIKIDFTAGTKEDVRVSEISLQIKRSEDEYDKSPLPQAGDLQDLRLQKDDGTYFGLIVDTVQGQKPDGSTIGFSGDLLIEAGSTKSLTLVADISATTTATFFETAIPMAYTASWVKSTGVNSNDDITESGGARRKVLIEGQKITFIGGGGGGGVRREDPEPPIEEYVTVSLSSENPASQDIIPPDPKATAFSSELMLVFDINNPFDREVAIDELAVLLEGTATPDDFGQIIWQSEGKLVGWSYFNDQGYARAPFPSTQGYNLPLLKVEPKSTKTVKVFVFLKPEAKIGGMANFALPEQTDYLISGETITGFPIRGNVMTIKAREKEKILNVSLCSDNPVSHKVAAGASTRPAELDSSGLPTSGISHLFLCFEIENPESQDIDIEKLGIKLEGTATGQDFGKIIWQVDGAYLGWSGFELPGFSPNYAYIPSTYSPTDPITIPANSKKTFKVFAFVEHDAIAGHTIVFSMPDSADYLSAPDAKIEGMPISGNEMTITKQVLQLELKSLTSYSVDDAQPGQALNAIFQLHNPYIGKQGLEDSGKVFITQLFLNEGTDTSFLDWVDKDSLKIRFQSPDGQIVTSKLRKRTTPLGLTVFDLLPAVELDQNKTTDVMLSLKIKDSAPEGSFIIKLTNISAYGGSTFSPVTLSDWPSIEIKVVK